MGTLRYKIIKFSGYIVRDETLNTIIIPEMNDKSKYNQYIKDDLRLSLSKHGYLRHFHLETEDVRDEDTRELLTKNNCDLAICEQYFHSEPSTTSKDKRVVKPGEKYRHFKTGYIVTVIAVAESSESPGSFSVIYQCGDDPTNIWYRPYDMFVSPVDKKKYPNATQYWRFEKVED